MNFVDHSNLAGKHAFLGASQYHWINYDDEKLIRSYENMLLKQRGTELHEFAAFCITLGQRLPKSTKALNLYVNDAIGYKMVPEQVLYYSENCFGTTDAISFRNNILRIHDYKSGLIPGHMEQLHIYAALFCLEYKFKPVDIEIELRMYQDPEPIVCIPDSEVINAIMNQIVSSDKTIRKIRIGER